MESPRPPPSHDPSTAVACPELAASPSTQDKHDAAHGVKSKSSGISMQVPKTVTKKKYLHFSSDIKRLYLLFRLEAQTRAEKMNVHAESIKFLQQHCPGMEISSASRQYQDWYREMNLHLTPQEIEQYKPSGWSVTNASRGPAKHRKVSAPSPEAAPPAISITSPVA